MGSRLTEAPCLLPLCPEPPEEDPFFHPSSRSLRNETSEPRPGPALPPDRAQIARPFEEHKGGYDFLPSYAHNDYIEMLVELGGPGFFLWILFTLLVIIRGIRLIRYRIATWECSCLIAALTSLGAFCWLNFVLPVPAVFLWQMLVLGLLQGLPSTPLPTSSPKLPQRLMALALMVVVLASSLFSFRSLQAARLVSKSQTLSQALRWEESIQLFDQALKWQPNQLDALVERGKLLTKMGLFLHKPDLTTRGEESLKQAQKVSPRDQSVTGALTLFYSAAGRYAEAERVLTEAHRYAPYHEWHLPALARLQLLQGRRETE